MKSLTIDGIDLIIDEVYREPEHASSLDVCAMAMYNGQSVTIPMNGKTIEQIVFGKYVIVVVEKNTNNRYRLVSPLEGKLVYASKNLPTVSLKEALSWKSSFMAWSSPTKYAWQGHHFYAIMPYDEKTLDWIRSYMPNKRASINGEMRRMVYAKCGGHCAYCGREIDISEMQVDHVESHYRHQGKDCVENYLPACRDCNGLKSDYLLEEFRNVLIPKCAKANPNSNTRAGRICKAYGLKGRPKRITFYFEKESKDAK